MRGRPVVTMVAAALVLTALLLELVLRLPWFPTEASTQAHHIRTLFNVLLIASAPIFALVVTVVVTSVIRFRMRPGQEHQDGPPIHGNTRLEAIWTAIPATLILGLCVYAYVVLVDIERAPQAAHREMSVQVVGEQFAWTFTYPHAVTHQRPLTTTQLWLPEGRSVRFDIRSVDVIHSFWVPNFAVKKDAVPGITTQYRITPDRLGTYPVVCNELCGVGHAFMRSTVHVVTPARFDAWLAHEVRPAPMVHGEQQLAALGRREFSGAAGCSACHRLADAHAAGTVGPDLDKGLKGRAAAFIRQCILDPNSISAPGYPKDVMPATFGKTLTPQQIDALVTYLHKVTPR